ncbi:MAG: NrsF family protein [Hyphomicrobiaceae bacterium]
MKLDELLRTLAEDKQRPLLRFRTQLAAALACAALISCVLLVLTAGVRPDLPGALLSWQVQVKFGFAISLLLSAYYACVQAAQPCTQGSFRVLLIAPGLLLAAVVVELATTSSRDWAAAGLGSHPGLCAVVVLLLSVLPLVAAMATLRRSAPISPARAGAMAGLVCCALGALVYMLRCTDDAPLFVAVWYAAAIAIVALAGFVIGRTALRW